MIDWITNRFALWTVLGTALAWLAPDLFLWVSDGSVRPLGQSMIAVLLGVIMLGMGLTLTTGDFRRVLALPGPVLAGLALQFTVMPLSGWALAHAFGLPAGLAVGLILVACCPGGTASNVVAFLARANLALSVTMTMASTLAAIVLTPVLTGWLAGVFVQIDRWNLFREMLVVVLVPVVAGVVLNQLFPRTVARVVPVAPLVSIVAVILIVASIIARSRALIVEHAGVLLLAVLLLHLSGFALGYLLARALGLVEADGRTISIEVGMQNSGLGSSLASTPAFQAQFASAMQAALAPVPSAISAIYHVVIGSLLAALWRRRPAEGDER